MQFQRLPSYLYLMIWHLAKLLRTKNIIKKPSHHTVKIRDMKVLQRPAEVIRQLSFMINS